MLAGRWTTAGALAAAGALVAACSSSDGGPALVSFKPEDCHGSLTEVARFSQTFMSSAGFVGNATVNNLALDGDTLYLMYEFASDQSGLPIGGGIVAVPVSGGAMRVVGAADNTSQWGAGAIWVTGGQVNVQFAGMLLSFPDDGAAAPATLPVVLSTALYGAYAHDAEFGYSAQGGGDADHLTVTKMPIVGGAPTTLVDEALPNMSLGGMADAGDALLLQLRWHPSPTETTKPSTAVWRIPKDGSPRSDVRPDVDWADALNFTEWLAWDGTNILGPIVVRNNIVRARVASMDRSAPQLVKLGGGVATRRGDEILSFQQVYVPQPHQTSTSRLLVASSKGAPAGSVVACGADAAILAVETPTGIAANDSAIYVAYSAGNGSGINDAVIARVTP